MEDLGQGERLRPDSFSQARGACLPQFKRLFHNDRVSLLAHFDGSDVKENVSIWCECILNTQHLPISLFNREKQGLEEAESLQEAARTASNSDFIRFQCLLIIHCFHWIGV